jgi:putative PIN family toxin of toxin-antitoxin system
VWVVFDTNIFISAFAIPGGNAEKAYLEALRGSFELLTSVAILTETANTLHSKFGGTDHRIQELLRAISKTATVLKTQPHIHDLEDEPDNRILECAVKADADWIVTGDKHLLNLQEFRGISIVKLADFLVRIQPTP